MLHEGKLSNFELTACSRDGHETVVWLNASPFYDADDNVVGVLASARDVTDRKQFEQVLQQTNLELERASKAKDLLLGNVSHELRTPLTAILGFSSTLLMGMPGRLNAEQRSQLERVESAGRQLLEIVTDLLDLTKIESSTLELRRVPILCHSVLEDVAQAMRSQAESKGLTVTIEAPVHEITLQTDRDGLTRILRNLTSNAIKYTETGSVTLGLAVHQATVCFSVADTGIGIAAADLQRVFNAFEHVGPPRTSGQAGPGLGLHVSQKMAETLGGTIVLSSEPGVGSRFTLELPAR